MALRVTNQMITNNFLQGLSGLQNQMQEYLLQLSTGSQTNTPGENPLGVGQVLRYNDILSQTASYQSNVNDGISWLQTTDTVLRSSLNLLQNAQQLAAQASNGTMSTTDLTAILQQVNPIINNLAEIGNTAYGNVYIFGGYQTTNPPFTVTTGGGNVTGVSYNGDSGTIQRQVGPGSQATINLTGNQVFGSGSITGTGANLSASGSGIFKDLLQFSADLQNTIAGNSAAQANISNVDITNINNDIKQLTEYETLNGARLQQFQAAKSNLTSFNMTVTNLLANVQDVDMAKTMADYSNIQTAYQASLNAGAGLLPPNLFSFLKL